VLPLKTSDFENVTMLAVIEHIENVKGLLSECKRVLKDNGRLIITTPAKRAKPILDIFSKIYLVDDRMISQHKRYYTRKTLKSLLELYFKEVKVIPFQFGFNLLVVCNNKKL